MTSPLTELDSRLGELENSTGGPLSLQNTAILREYFKKEAYSPALFMTKHYEKGITLVREGVTTEDSLLTDPSFQYAKVPLGFILQGEIIVTKGGKATKQLRAGDFIGLFETGDWLATHQSRHIGDWTLTSHTPDTEVLYFSQQSLEHASSATEELRNYLVEAARSDQVPQPLTSLPLLDWVASHTTSSRLSDYTVIAHTHLLPNNLPFFRHLSYLVGFGRMFILEKPYSTVPEVRSNLIQAGNEVIQVKMETGLPYEFAVQKSLEILWSKVIEEQKRNNVNKILIIDDGGDVWLSIPWTRLEGISITGVEQTQRGISRVQHSSIRIPSIVSVASSGIKKNIESDFIGKSIVNKLQELTLTKKQIGVLGNGSIGKAILKSLRSLGKAPFYYDPESHQDLSPEAQPSLDSLINNSEVIIGTTGTDALKGAAFDRMNGNKILASASSADVEFTSILKLAPEVSSPFEDLHIEVNDRLAFTVLNGGFPLNFDRVKDATPDNEIVLTRCLMYIGAMEAVKILENGGESGIYELDPESQKELLAEWIEQQEEKGLDTVIDETEVDCIIETDSTFKAPIGVWKD